MQQAQGVVPTRQSVQRLTDSSRQSPVPTVLTMDGSCVGEDFDEDMRECIAAYEESSLRCASPSGSLQMRPPTSSRARFVRQTNSLRDSWGSGPHGDPAGGAGEHPWPGAAPPGAAPGSPGGFQVPGAFGPVLTVMVGGVEFKSTGSTLRRAPHFESVLSQGGQLPNPLFIDRSGDLFKYILDYLRSGHWLLGSPSPPSPWTSRTPPPTWPPVRAAAASLGVAWQASCGQRRDAGSVGARDG